MGALAGNSTAVKLKQMVSSWHNEEPSLRKQGVGKEKVLQVNMDLHTSTHMVMLPVSVSLSLSFSGTHSYKHKNNRFFKWSSQENKVDKIRMKKSEESLRT